MRIVDLEPNEHARTTLNSGKSRAKLTHILTCSLDFKKRIRLSMNDKMTDGEWKLLRQAAQDLARLMGIPEIVALGEVIMIIVNKQEQEKGK